MLPPLVKYGCGRRDVAAFWLAVPFGAPPFVQMVKFTWIGHASVRVEASGKVFFFDPWIQGDPVAKMKLEDVKLADVVCVTHGHDDHIGDSVALVKKTGAMLICSPEIGIYVHKKRAGVRQAFIPGQHRRELDG